VGEDAWSRLGVAIERGGLHAADAVRRISDPDRLAKLVEWWIRDHRTAARHALECYLEQPLDTFGHEVLVKRWFHHARRSRDHEVMGWFFVACDRSIRREVQTRLRQRHGSASSEEEARRLGEQWRSEGWSQIRIWRTSRTSYHVAALGGLVETLVSSRRTMPRDRLSMKWVADRATGAARRVEVPEWSIRLKTSWEPVTGSRHPGPAELSALRRYGLFTLGTRLYLRRACWRYFRELGRVSADEYPRAMAAILVRYREGDTATSQNLLDNYGLMHVLFHESHAVTCHARGWRWGDPGVALEPAPAYLAHWLERPEYLLDVAAGADSGLVRQWAAALLARSETAERERRSILEWAGLLAIPELASWAGRRLLEAEGLGTSPRRNIERMLHGDREGEPAGDEKAGSGEGQEIALLCDVARYWRAGPVADEHQKAWRGLGLSLMRQVTQRLENTTSEGPLWVPWLARWMKGGCSQCRRAALVSVVSYGARGEKAAHLVRRFIPRLRWGGGSVTIE
jgi:hypothetical protein